MITRLTRFLLILSLISFISGCRPDKDKGDVLRIAIASNLQYAMDSLVSGFEHETDLPCELIPGSSGKLFAQIREGAPYDLFLSADLMYPKTLYDQGMALEQPEIFAYGSLVLWSVNPDLHPSMNILETESIRHIAMANPEIAPFGKAAREALEHYGLDHKLSQKMVYGESVAQTSQFIASGAAEIGFTSLAIVISPDFENIGRWSHVDPSSYSPLPHGVVLLRNGQDIKPGARAFYQYLFSDKGQAILKYFGYSVHE